jgi:hypothetical protein
MKKIYLLTAVALLVTVFSATAQRVILRLPANYDISIDDRYYVNNESINDIGYGQHTVKLYQVRPGIFGVGKRRTLVTTSSFSMRNNDVAIEVDQYGQMRIYETGNYNNQNGNNGSNNNNGDYSCQKRNGKGYGPYNNPGRGNKYGLYKKQNGKHKKHDKHDRDDNDD